MKRIVVSGYYGFGNVGDEAVLAGISATLNAVGVEAEITVLSANPAHTMRDHPGVTAVPRTGAVPVIRAIRRADLFISGGGSLFQDSTSAQSPYYYLSVLRLAQMLRRKTMIYAQGVGPLIRPAIRRAVARAFDKTYLITVRDSDSKTLLEEIGVTREVHVMADPSFAVEPDVTAASEIIETAGLAREGIIGVSLRTWQGYEEWVEQAAETITRVCVELGAQPVFLPMQEPEDSAIGGSGVVLRHKGNPYVAKGLIARCDLVIGMRLHSLLFAAGAGVPFVPIAYDPKVSAFAAEAGSAAHIEIGDSMEELDAAIRQAWNERQALANDLTARAERFRDSALSAGRLAAALLEQPGGTLRVEPQSKE